MGEDGGHLVAVDAEQRLPRADALHGEALQLRVQVRLRVADPVDVEQPHGHARSAQRAEGSAQVLAHTDRREGVSDEDDGVLHHASSGRPRNRWRCAARTASSRAWPKTRSGSSCAPSAHSFQELMKTMRSPGALCARVCSMAASSQAWKAPGVAPSNTAPASARRAVLSQAGMTAGKRGQAGKGCAANFAAEAS